MTGQATDRNSSAAPQPQHSRAEPAFPDAELTHRRLKKLYEISQLLATPQDLTQTFQGVADIVKSTLAIRTAILIDADGDHHKIITWVAEEDSSDALSAEIEHAEASYAHAMDAWPEVQRGDSERFVVLPVSVPHHALLGVLQLEIGPALGKADRSFVDAIVSQLAVALERSRSRRRDRRKRTDAEQRRKNAEAHGVMSEQELVSALRSSAGFEALAERHARSYDEARRAVGIREQLLAVVSHDLKNPLATILLGAEALLEGADLPETVGRIQRAANRMLRLIEDLLDFASIEAGRLSIRRDPHDPAAMIEETIASFAGARRKGVQISAQVARPLPMVFCDRDRILQVLSNLVGNAISALVEGGHIVLRVEARAHDVLFAVSDDGPGIPAQDLEHVFDRYWRSDLVDYRGTGLGLAIASGIVVAHDGKMWIESILGCGATFHFTIPIVDLTPLFSPPSAGEQP